HHQLVEIERVGVEVLLEAGSLLDRGGVDLELLGEVLADETHHVIPIHCKNPTDRRDRASGRRASHRPRPPPPAPPPRRASPPPVGAASRTALAMPSGPALPWATTAIERRPSRIAPPAESGWSRRRTPPSAGRIRSPPAAASGLDRAALRIAPATVRAVPS